MGAEDHTREHSFDNLARGLANGTLSRKRALKMLGGGLLGGMLASVPGLAWAQARSCPQGERRCPDGTCVPVGQDCPTVVGCPPGQTNCAGGPGQPQCVDLQTDSNNCGACGNVCPQGATCGGGQCSCPSGTTLCGSICLDTTCQGGSAPFATVCGCDAFGSGICVCDREFGTGRTVCGGSTLLAGCVINCNSTSECPPGSYCSQQGTSGLIVGACRARCGTDPQVTCI